MVLVLGCRCDQCKGGRCYSNCQENCCDFQWMCGIHVFQVEAAISLICEVVVVLLLGVLCSVGGGGGHGLCKEKP